MKLLKHHLAAAGFLMAITWQGPVAAQDDYESSRMMGRTLSGALFCKTAGFKERPKALDFVMRTVAQRAAYSGLNLNTAMAAISEGYGEQANIYVNEIKIMTAQAEMGVDDMRPIREQYFRDVVERCETLARGMDTAILFTETPTDTEAALENLRAYYLPKRGR